MMRKAGVTALLIAAAAVGITTGGAILAQGVTPGAVCDAAAEAAAKEILGRLGVPVDAAEVGYAAVAEYLRNPDDTRLQAAMDALGQGSAGLIFPSYGIAVKGGRIAVGGVEYTIEEARSQQIYAFLCGGASAGEHLPAHGFFDIGATQALAPGISCSNFADKVTTLEQFGRLETLFKGFYTRSVLELGGRQNEANYRQILHEQWQIIERTWKARTGIRLLDRLRADLIAAARSVKVQPACTAPAEEGGRRFELVGMEDEIAPTVPEWRKEIGPGRMTVHILPNLGHEECTWTAPPRRIDLQGFEMTLGVAVTADPNSNISGQIALRSGLRVASQGTPTDVLVYAERGATARQSVTVKLEPMTFDSLTLGSPLYLSVGCLNVGTVHYTYEFRE